MRRASILCAVIAFTGCEPAHPWNGTFEGGVKTVILGSLTQTAVHLEAVGSHLTIHQVYVNGSGMRFDYRCEGDLGRLPNTHSFEHETVPISCDAPGSSLASPNAGTSWSYDGGRDAWLLNRWIGDPVVLNRVSQ